MAKKLIEKTTSLPSWSIYVLIITTLLLSLLILARIWFPHYFDEDFFWKIIWTYLILIASTAVISRMAAALKYINDGSSDAETSSTNNSNDKTE